MKVAYSLEVNEDGYPPISIELLNAARVSGDTFRIENSPFFAENVAFHDVVRARATDVPGQFQFSEVVEESPFASISIILLDKAMDRFLMDLLRGFGCVLEYGEFAAYRVLAVAVPPRVDYEPLRRQLTDLEGRGLLSFAELALPKG